MQQQGYSTFHRSHQYPFYRTYIDIVSSISQPILQQCRKDILTQNEHMNKKIKSQISPFMTKVNKKLKQNKLRLAYFIGFICLFKLQPVYDYFFQKNYMINWVYNNVINYYTDCTKPIPKSIKQLQRQKRLVNKNQTSKKLSELFYKIDRQYPLVSLGYKKDKDIFVVVNGNNNKNNNNNNDIVAQQHNTNNFNNQLSLQEFLKICTTKYNNNISQIQTQLNNLLIYNTNISRQSMYIV